jgi:hypothetical protein
MAQRPVDTVTDFYAALAAADADAIASVIDTYFADEAAIEWPPSLPHGGRVEGSRRLRAIFTGIAKPGAAGATNLKLVRAIGEGDDVVAWLTFDWKLPGSDVGTPNEALELWRFSDGLVRDIRAYYWDHAAITQPQHA